MKKTALLTVLFVYFLLQTLLSDRMTLGRVSPDFPLLIVAYLAVYRGAFHGSIAGFIVGFLQDLFNPSFLGLNAFTKTLTGYVLGLGGSKTEADSSLFLFALFGAAALAHDFVYLLLFTGLRLGEFVLTWVTVSIPSALYTALIGVVVHKLVALSLTEAVRHLGKARS
jgi:rod shape-determining protein MreD